MFLNTTFQSNEYKGNGARLLLPFTAYIEFGFHRGLLRFSFETMLVWVPRPLGLASVTFPAIHP